MASAAPHVHEHALPADAPADLVAFKLRCFAVIALIALVGGLAPLLISSGQNASNAGPIGRFISWGNALSGGVFFAAGLAHMLPEAAEGFAKLDGYERQTAFILATFGALGALLAEKLGATLQGQGGGASTDASSDGLEAASGSAASSSATIEHSALGGNGSGHAGALKGAAASSGASAGTGAAASSGGKGGSGGGNVLDGGRSEAEVHGDVESGVLPDEPNASGPRIATKRRREQQQQQQMRTAAHSHRHAGGHGHVHAALPSGGRTSILLSLLLSVHSLIEGMALGVEDTMSDTTGVLIAIVGHKFFAAFALGAHLAKHRPAGEDDDQLLGNNSASSNWMRLRHLASSISGRHILFFSAMSPLGILLGMSAASLAFPPVFTEVIKAVSAGTFISISLVEIIGEEFSDETAAGQQSRGIKTILVLLGAASMSFFAHNHAHSDSAIAQAHTGHVH